MPSNMEDEKNVGVDDEVMEIVLKEGLNVSDAMKAWLQREKAKPEAERSAEGMRTVRESLAILCRPPDTVRITDSSETEDHHRALKERSGDTVEERYEKLFRAAKIVAERCGPLIGINVSPGTSADFVPSEAMIIFMEEVGKDPRADDEVVPWEEVRKEADEILARSAEEEENETA